MLKASDFVAELKKTANVKTLYVMGGFGAPAGYGNNRNRYMNNNAYNKQPERQKMIQAAAPDTFFFDCVGLCKSTLWGFNRDASRVYGGASYASNGVPDYDAKEMMFSGCTDHSKDFSHIVPGEFLWLDGHCGIYIGDGLAIESTPAWKNGVQITAVGNIGSKAGYNSRRWTYHGRLKYVDYKDQPAPVPSDEYKAGNVYTVSCKGPLRIRKGPGTDKDIIDDLYRGDKVLCDGVVKDKDGNTWLKITGYTCAKYGKEVYINDH